jgi:hypothetical protein
MKGCLKVVGIVLLIVIGIGVVTTLFGGDAERTTTLQATPAMQIQTSAIPADEPAQAPASQELPVLLPTIAPTAAPVRPAATEPTGEAVDLMAEIVQSDAQAQAVMPTVTPVIEERTQVMELPAQNGGACDPSYPDVCIPPLSVAGDLNCADVPQYANFRVLPPDPHGLDGRDDDGYGCESN